MSGIRTISRNPLENFYSEYFLFSYSSLNKLLHSPQSFFNWYILKEKKDSLESHLVEGSVIHCLLLDPDEFNNQFTIMPGSIPGATNKKIVESIYLIHKNGDEPNKLFQDYDQEILNWLKENNKHQSLVDDKDKSIASPKTGDQKRLSKVLNEKTKSYFNYLVSSESKIVIDADIYNRCLSAVEILKSNINIINLIQYKKKSDDFIEIYNEKPLSCQLKNLPFGLKGIIDNYVINHLEKTIYINDLKTTGKSLTDFPNSLEYYKYWMQCVIYINLVRANHPELKDYKIVFHFIVIDKYNQLYPFPVGKESINNWQIQLEEILKIANYHYTNKSYNLPYEFAKGNVIL